MSLVTYMMLVTVVTFVTLLSLVTPVMVVTVAKLWHMWHKANNGQFQLVEQNCDIIHRITLKQKLVQDRPQWGFDVP